MATKKIETSPMMYQQPAGNNQLTLFLSILALLASVYTFSRVQALEKTLEEGVPTAVAGAGQAPGAEPTQDLTKMPDVTASDWIKGDRNAQVVLVEYSDYQCPFCQRFHPTMQQVMKDYAGKVAWVFRQYPLSFHPYAQKAAEAAECVGKVGGNDKFWSFTDMVYTEGAKAETNLSVDNLVKMSGTLGVDSTKVKACIDSGEMAAKVKSDMDGGTAAGVSGTPGTIVVGKNGKREFIGGAFPIDQVKASIDKVLNN